MVSKKQRFKTVVLVLVFALAIIGGVFGISYYKGILTFPWQVTEASVASKEVAQQPETAQTEEVTTTEQVKEEPAEEATKEEVVKEEKPEKKDKSETAKTEDAEDEVSEESQETSEEDADSNVATTGNTLDYYGALHVEDGSLVDEAGDAVQLTGVSSHGLSWYPEYVTAESIKSLRETLGINVIRLAVYTSDYNGYCVGGEEIQSVIKDNIDEAVKAATDSDMYVILDWHILNDGDPNEYKSEAIQFFGEMVRKYEDNENVIYEICNEPNGDTTWADIKKYAKEVIPVIRNVNKDALILVGTPEWSSDLDSVLEDPLDFDNIMYTYHFYAGSHKASARNTLTNALESGLPVFISEYGFTAADGDGAIDKKEAAKWLEIIDEFKLSSCIWNLSNKDEGSALIANDCDKTSDFEYEDFSEQGKYFFDILKETNGNDNQRED
ncbi:MAG: glycoside hydrolase family 5 protein [Pseudobutyrivibrio sp.]|nr:glycoside hydrolase family 5 protein [Pseudobutyrivibrio sp.]